MFNTSQIADNLPRVTTKKRERLAASQAKQVIGMGKRKRRTKNTRTAPAKRRQVEPQPDVVPVALSVDRQPADDLFVPKNTKQRAMVSHLFASLWCRV
jgi:hypothetical protein